MTIRKTTYQRQANEKRWLEALYDRWPVQEEQAGINYIDLAKQLGATPAPFLKAVDTYKDAGILITRLVYKRGRQSFWTLAVPRDEALSRLANHHRTEQAAMTTTQPKPEPTPLVAVSGDEADASPFEPLAKLKGRDEEEALLQAARQYAGRKQILADTVKQLEAAGINAKSDAFEFKSDPRLDAVCLVLPAIDRRDNMIAYYEERDQQWREKMRPMQEQIEELKRENNGLRRVVDRLQEGSTSSAQVVHSR